MDYTLKELAKMSPGMMTTRQKRRVRKEFLKKQKRSNY